MQKLIEAIASYFPDVRHPIRRLNFKERAKWTLIVLGLYFLLSSIPLYGLSARAIDYFQNVRVIIAGNFGSLLTLGIGPIVTAGIILQLLVGSELLPLDLSNPQDKRKYEIYEKFLVVIITLFEAASYVLLGGLPPQQNTLFMKLLLIIQLLLGTFIIVLLDQISQRWGFISGISLFIAASVSSRLVTALLNPLANPQNPGVPAGKLWAAIHYLIQGDPSAALAAFLPIFFTFLILAIAIYAAGIKVEIPIMFSKVRGYTTRWPLNLFYTSNIPVIFTAALMANIELLFRFLGARGLEIFAKLDASGNPIGGLIMYFIPPRDLIFYLMSPKTFFEGVIAGGVYRQILLRAIFYTLFMVFGSLFFARFWVYTSNMDAESVAKQLTRGGMGIPGFRRDYRVLKRVLERYIPYLTDIGAIAVGLLAAFADFTSALARGTGILLTVMILQRLYQVIVMRYAMDMAPEIKKFFTGE